MSKVETDEIDDKVTLQWNVVYFEPKDLNQDELEKIIIAIYEYQEQGERVCIGKLQISYNKLRENVEKGYFYQYTISENMQILIDRIQIKQKESFLDYILGGCEIVVGFGVGFAADQKEQTQNSEDKIKAMETIGSFLESYNSDTYMNVYGFNGKLPGTSNHTSRCFALNGKFFNPDVRQDHLIETY